MDGFFAGQTDPWTIFTIVLLAMATIREHQD